MPVREDGSHRSSVDTPASTHKALDLLGHECRGLMFPESEHQPTCGREFLIMPSIALDVGRQFVDPPTPICVRRRSMLRTRVPEAPIKENRDTFRRKRQVGTSPRNA